MKTEAEIFEQMVRMDFGEPMSDKTKLDVLNWTLEQVYEQHCKCYRFAGSNKEYQTNLCPIHNSSFGGHCVKSVLLAAGKLALASRLVTTSNAKNLSQSVEEMEIVLDTYDDTVLADCAFSQPCK